MAPNVPLPSPKRATKPSQLTRGLTEPNSDPHTVVTTEHASANLVPAATLREAPPAIKYSDYINITTEKEKREKAMREKGEPVPSDTVEGGWVNVTKEMGQIPQKPTVGNDLSTYVKMRKPSFSSGPGLASSFYAGLSPEEKKKIDEEAARLGMK